MQSEQNQVKKGLMEIVASFDDNIAFLGKQINLVDKTQSLCIQQQSTWFFLDEHIFWCVLACQLYV